MGALPKIINCLIVKLECLRGVSVKVLVLGGSGELGSNFSKLCIDRGHEVRIIDLVRFFEAWRLKELGISDKVEYVWKSTFDLTYEDVAPFSLILDCACQADRPLGTSSPRHTLMDNLLGPLTLLEVIREIRNYKPFIIYPSSSVEFLGVPKEEQPITERTHPKPTNLYGLTKWMAEELYLTYYRTFGMPCIIIRTGSCYGPMMRTDQFIAQCIIKCLKNQDVIVKSPEATRTYTYTGDVLEFYRLLLEKFEKFPSDFEEGLIIANGGNAENKPYKTLEVAELIQELTGATNQVLGGEYEFGELINYGPVYQHEKGDVAEKLLGWKPKYTLQKGLLETIEWFRTWLKK